jgi:hypothetical protein
VNIAAPAGHLSGDESARARAASAAKNSHARHDKRRGAESARTAINRPKIHQRERRAQVTAQLGRLKAAA